MVNDISRNDHPGMDTKTRVGMRVRTIRKQRGLTQEQLAEMIERSVDTISLIERGQVLPSFETLENLGERLGVPLKDFVDFQKDSSPERLRLETLLIELSRELDTEQLALAVSQLAALAEYARNN